MNLSSIEIDFDIHKLIEAERRSFDEAPYLALRRLLDLPDMAGAALDGEGPDVMGEGRPWRDGPVEIPHGSLARMSYQRGRQVYEGQFLDGNLVVYGRAFNSLSSAASALAVTKDGSTPSLNGWEYWEVKLPGETKWKKAKQLRIGRR